MIDIPPGLALVLGGTVPALVVAWDNRRQHRKTIGTPNGKGNVVQMQEDTLRIVGRIEERLDQHINDHDAHAGHGSTV